MAVIAPLSPLRYPPARLPTVVAPPYDVISADERAALFARDSANVVRLILPDAISDDPNSKYQGAANLVKKWVNEGTLVRDDEPAFYRYDQIFVPPGGGPPSTRTGFLALVQLRPFSDRVVLPHERTLRGPKEDRLKLFRATETNLSPGFMLYRDPQQTLRSALNCGIELARFESQAHTEPYPITNVISKIANLEARRAIVDYIAKTQLLIADGHHRYETAVHYRDEVESTRGPTPPLAEHKYFMAYLANEDDPGLLVFPTHRLVHGLPQFSLANLLEKIGGAFHSQVLETSAPVEIAQKLAESGKNAPSLVAVTPGAKPVLLSLRADFDPAKHPTLGARSPALRKTDIAILHALILEHALGISLEDQAKQTNLTYFKDTKEALRRIENHEGNALFLMNATPVSQVRAVAEEGEVMPQKATYFYPKVLTGLAIHTLHADRTISAV